MGFYLGWSTQQYREGDDVILPDISVTFSIMNLDDATMLTITSYFNIGRR